MTDKEKVSAEKLAKAVEVLPDDKKQYILGYADGMADALDKGDEDERKE